jgi:hypothetical protein
MSDEAPEADPNPEDLPEAAEAVAAADPPPTPVEPKPEHVDRLNEAAVARAETRAQRDRDDRQMRREIADRVFWLVVVQVALADMVFIAYADAEDWHIADSIDAWLAATVVQVIAMALVILRSLFAPRE